jgi:hypothetical protein
MNFRLIQDITFTATLFEYGDALISEKLAKIDIDHLDVV